MYFRTLGECFRILRGVVENTGGIAPVIVFGAELCLRQ